MIHGKWTERQHRYPLLVDEVPINFLLTHNQIKVSIPAMFLLLCSYENSWGIMVILPSPTASTVKETSLLILSHLPQNISSQNSIKYLKLMGMISTPGR